MRAKRFFLVRAALILFLLPLCTDAIGAVIPPDDPGPADVRLSVDSTLNNPISRLIYGLNGKFSDAAGWGSELPSGITLTRLGGNRWTVWNWENGWSNAGSDWYYSNDQYLTTNTAPGAAVKPEADAAFAANTGIVITMPIIGWVSKSVSGINIPPPSAPNQTTPATPSSTYFQPMVPKNPIGAGSGVPHGNNGTIYADDFVKWLNTAYPGRASHATAPLLLSLDNEPELWGSTHREIRGRTSANQDVYIALNLAGQDELVSKSIATAAAAKDVIPGIQTMGFVSYGWQGMINLQSNPLPPYNRPGGGTYNWYVDVFLDKMKQASDAQSRRLLDILDVHWYPEAQGSGIVELWEPGIQMPEIMLLRTLKPRTRGCRRPDRSGTRNILSQVGSRATPAAARSACWDGLRIQLTPGIPGPRFL